MFLVHILRKARIRPAKSSLAEKASLFALLQDDDSNDDCLAYYLYIDEPRGYIYTTIVELGPKRPSPLWVWKPNSIIVVYMDPVGNTIPLLTNSHAFSGPSRGA